MSKPLTTRTQTRGVLPKKISDLPNDVGYVTRKELDDFLDITQKSTSNKRKNKLDYIKI